MLAEQPQGDVKKYIVCSTDPLTNVQTNFVTLPFNRNQNLKVVLGLWFQKFTSINRFIICWGNISGARSFQASYSSRSLLYRGDWTNTYVSYPDGSVIQGAFIDFPNKTFGVTLGDGTVVQATDSGSWTSVNGAFKLPLSNPNAGSNCIYQHRIQAYQGDALLYDLIADEDGNGTACMKDILTGTCYYDDNGETYLVDL